MIARNVVRLVDYEVKDLGDEVDGVGYLDSSCMANLCCRIIINKRIVNLATHHSSQDTCTHVRIVVARSCSSRSWIRNANSELERLAGRTAWVYIII
jgi:hypothetical protein